MQTRTKVLIKLVTPLAAFLAAFGLASLFIVDSTLLFETEKAEPAATVADPREAEIAALSDEYGCSRTGLAPGVVPVHSIILDPAGEVRLATFDEGWAIYEGNADGTLVAVCAK